MSEDNIVLELISKLESVINKVFQDEKTGIVFRFVRGGFQQKVDEMWVCMGKNFSFDRFLEAKIKIIGEAS